MKKDEDHLKEDYDSGPNLSNFTLNNFKTNNYKQLPTLPFFEYPEVHIDNLSPICYNSIQDQKIKLNLYHEETLFYIFYTYTETDVQKQVYNLLITKGYWYCTIYKCFICFDGKKIIDNQNRKISIFDPFHWKKIEKNVNFDKEFVDSIKGTI